MIPIFLQVTPQADKFFSRNPEQAKAEYVSEAMAWTAIIAFIPVFIILVIYYIQNRKKPNFTEEFQKTANLLLLLYFFFLGIFWLGLQIS